MKKRFIMIAMTGLMAVVSFGQSIGIKGGLSLANANYEVFETALSTEVLSGFHIGLVSELPVSEALSFSPGILYSQKGFKMNFMGVEVKMPITYIEIPLNLTYKYNAGGLSLFGQAGPYLGGGISAKAKSGNEEEEIEFGSGDEELKQFDFGVNIGAGIQITNLQFSINYGQSLVNLENDSDALAKLNVISLSVAYFFGN